MVYGPTDRYSLSMMLNPLSETEDRSIHLVPCHKFPQGTSAKLMVEEVMEMIQTVEGSVGKDFSDSFMVMPEEDALTPWSAGFGCAGWVLTYKKGSDYGLYLAKREGLYDWFVPGGRWAEYLKAKSRDIPDAHGGTPDLKNFSLALLSGVIAGTEPPPPPTEGLWSSLAIKDVDWDKMADELPDAEFQAIAERNRLKEKGVELLTIRQYFFTLYPSLYDQVGPDNLSGYQAARRWDTYWAYSKYLTDMRIEHDIPQKQIFSMEPYRWSNELLMRLAKLRAKVLSCFIIHGIVYDFDNECQSEEHLHKGLDLLEALPEDTIVSVVDVHY